MSGMDPKRSSVLVHDWEAALNAASGKYNEPRPPPPDYLQWLEDGCPLYVSPSSFFLFRGFFFLVVFLPFENNWSAEKFKHTVEIEPIYADVRHSDVCLAWTAQGLRGTSTA